MHFSKFLWDENSTRYQLVQSNGTKPYNWLFLPGGPGADSRYFIPLIKDLHLPGNVWLIDFPSNGDNTDDLPLEYPFDQWENCLLSIVEEFENPLIVGHSFGGMYPLMFPELEEILKGFVILSSAPSLWLVEAAKKAEEKNIPLLAEPMQNFVKNPSQETFKAALLACTPYYFPEESLEKGKLLFEGIPMNYHAAVWWQQKAHAINFSAKWVPEKVPTLIISGTEDCITPSTLFERDTRFKKPNIMRHVIEGGGHFPWIEKYADVEKSFKTYIKQL